MTRATQLVGSSRWAARATALSALTLAVLGLSWMSSPAHGANYPVTEQQRGTAQKVAQSGVALSELAANAPDSYRIKRGDTLWDISRLFLKSPWRWPELWGMNMDQIRNPHLIYPGQMLYLEKSNGRARLRVGQQVGGEPGVEKLSPRTRSEPLGNAAIPTIPLSLIEPFLNEAVIFQTDEQDSFPRIVAAQEGRVLLSRGDLAYVRGELTPQQTSYRIFRELKPLTDPTTNEVLGYEAAYVGMADFLRPGDTQVGADGKPEVIPATFTVSSVRQEARIGDRLSPPSSRDFENFVPRAPEGQVAGQIVSVYGEALNAGQNQIVALNRGARDGVERGHVLALLRDGARVIDRTDSAKATMKLPDERHGNLLVFRVFNNMSYALILSVQDPVKRGDRFSQP
ncbi:MAG: LysM domain-containing protein [Pseudomonadota bacterium]